MYISGSSTHVPSLTQDSLLHISCKEAVVCVVFSDEMFSFHQQGLACSISVKAVGVSVLSVTL